MLQKKLGERSGQTRRYRKLTQARLANRVGCSVELISLLERGVSEPSIAGLERFSGALKVDVRESFTFDNSDRPPKKG